MGPNLVVFLIYLGFAGATGVACYGLGKLRPARRVVDEIAADVHEAHRAAWPCWCWEDDDDEADMRDLREADDPAGLGAYAADRRALPSDVPAVASGRVVAELTYDLDHPAPARVYPELAPEALDDVPRPPARYDDCGGYPGWPHTVGCRNDVSRPASSSSGRAGTPDLSDDPDLLEWDARANAARCGEIVVELRELGVMLAGWRPVLPPWDRELVAA